MNELKMLKMAPKKTLALTRIGASDFVPGA